MPTQREIEAELLAASRQFLKDWTSRADGAVECCIAHMAPDMTGIGSGADEVFSNRDEFAQALQRQHVNVPQLSYHVYGERAQVLNATAGLVNGNVTVEVPLESGEAVSLTFRFTYVFRQTGGRWKIVHGHVSRPDMEQAEGESLPIDALRARNEELEREVAERTAEIEAARREAEIEAALERVRSRTMAMHESAELGDVIQVVFRETLQLGIGAKACDLVILDEATGASSFWIYRKQGQALHFQLPRLDHPHYTATLNAWANDQAVRQTVLEGEECADFMQQLTESATTSNMPDSVKAYLRDLRFIIHTEAYMRHGYFRVASLEPLDEEAKAVLQRFAHVFEQTYTRFLDLKQAETQAREAQIEAALERVRARAMAMHSSEDLSDTVNVFFQELKKLGVTPIRCGVAEVKPATRSWTLAVTNATQQGDSFELLGEVSKLGHPILERIYDHWETQEEYFFVLQGADLKPYYQVLRPQISVPDFPEDAVQHGNYFYFKEGFVFAWTEKALSQEVVRIFRRFTSVLSLTYRRYLDLKEAEAQAREAHIEAALERVRARAMAMHQSDELAEAASVLFQQMGTLGIEVWACGFNIWHPDAPASTSWMSTADGSIQAPFTMPHTEDSTFRRILEARQQDDTLYVEELGGEALAAHYQYLMTVPGVQAIVEQFPPDIPFPEHQVFHAAHFEHGYLMFITLAPCPKDGDLFKRFARVFEQTYTRFLDLKQAEEQAREAQMEAALERVRSRTMAMHHSDELREVVSVLFEQFQRLDFDAPVCSIGIFEEATRSSEWWVASNSEAIMLRSYRIPYLEGWPKDWYQTVYNNWQQQVPFFMCSFEGEDKRAFDHKLLTETEFRLASDDHTQDLVPLEGVIISYTAFSHGVLEVASVEPIPNEKALILQRFARVFEQTYTRFLDLKQAEEQAREAQIEAALERVRSRTMAMHRSDELADVIAVVFRETLRLGFGAMACDLVILDEMTGASSFWISGERDTDVNYLHAAAFDHPHYQAGLAAWKNNEAVRQAVLEGEDCAHYMQQLLASATETNLPAHLQAFLQNLRYVAHTEAYMRHGYFRVASQQPLADEQTAILQRFSRVFEQTYTRFLDLKKAEAQAREAQIEAALERVRSCAMAMHHSDDLASAVASVFEELDRLGLSALRCGIGIVNGPARCVRLWTTTATHSGEAVQVSGDEPLEGHPLLDGIFEAWKQQEDLHYVLEGNDRRRYYEVVAGTNFHIPETAVTSAEGSITREYYHSAMFPAGGLYAFREEPLSDEGQRILRRLADVFHLAYTRYEDLQQAEARAREAIQSASLDRVRAEIASMRTTDDLQRITPLVWRELTTLGVPFIRCGVFIMDEATQVVETYLTRPDGTSLAMLRLPFDSAEVTRNAVQAWKQQQVYTEQWDRAQFVAWMRSMQQQGLLETTRPYQGEAPPEQLTLQMVPFAQGMLYVGSETRLAADQIDLAQTLADAFAVAYARYEDFQRLEAAKGRVEATLNELQAAQQQLVHAEKMASLGALTAGIAHEIKNPLNFINNFAEVNEELAQELRTDLADHPDALALVEDLLADLEQNAAVIAQHGKRADGIVKSMMAHAREGKGEREAVNLNALIDEHVELAYHGKRAQVPGFNVDLERNYDDAVGSVEVVPQDFGRVMLNLIGNAFDAVTEKAASMDEKYEPVVRIVSCKKENGVEIRVEDNGPGMSMEVKAKVFEPFFTTKPTGSGTGLGLSLSYDIVTQGHGGTLSVDSEEGKGASFCITLPDTRHEALA